MLTEKVILTNDAVISYLGVMGFEPGAIVATGTGVISLASGRWGNFSPQEFASIARELKVEKLEERLEGAEACSAPEMRRFAVV